MEDALPADVTEAACVADLREEGSGTVVRVGPGEDHETIAGGISAAGAGGTVLVAPGSYSGKATITADDVTVLGACADAVTWSAEATDAGTLTINGARAKVAGLTIRGGVALAVEVYGDDARLESLRVEPVGFNGIVLDADGVSLRRVDVQGMVCAAIGSFACASVDVLGGTATWDGGRVGAGEGFGVYVRSDAVLTLTDLIVADVRPVPGAIAAGGIVASAATVELNDGVVVERVDGVAIGVSDGGLVRSVGDVVVRDIYATGGSVAVAVYAVGGASLDLGSGFRIEGVGGPAISLAGAGDSRLDGVIVEGACRLYPEEFAAVNIESTSSGADLAVERLEVRDVDCPGVWLFDIAGAALAAVSVEGARGVGVWVESADVVIHGLSVSGTAPAREYEGIGLFLEHATAVVNDVAIDGNADFGVAAFRSSLTLTDGAVSANSAAGIALIASDASLADSVISGTRVHTARAWGGYGIYASERDSEGEHEAPGGSAEVLLTGLTLDGNAGASVLVADGVAAELRDVTLKDTAAGAVGGDAVVIARGGSATIDGIGSSGGARASILFSAASGSVAGSSGTEPLGLRQQACEGVEPIDLSGQDLAAFPGGVLLCEGDALPEEVRPISWTSDVDIQD